MSVPRSAYDVVDAANRAYRTGAEKVCLYFGAGYLQKVTVKKAFSEAGPIAP